MSQTEIDIIQTDWRVSARFSYLGVHLAGGLYVRIPHFEIRANARQPFFDDVFSKDSFV